MNPTKIITLLAILAMVGAAAFAFPPHATAEPEIVCHPQDGYNLWAYKNLSIEVSPIDIDYETCNWIGPIVDIPGDIHVNSTQDIPNNDAYTNLQISAGHISEIHRWYLVKNPTDYELKVKLVIDEELSSNIDHIIEMRLFIGSEEHILVFNGSIENGTVTFSLQPMEMQEISFQVSMEISGKTPYTSHISMQEYIQLVPDVDA